MFDILPHEDISIEQLKDVYQNGSRKKLYALHIDIEEIYRLKKDSPLPGEEYNKLGVKSKWQVYFDNPEFFEENNTQNEFTIHNLEPVQGVLAEVYIIIGFFGAFGWLILSKLPQRIQSGFLRYIFPAKYLSPYFFFVFFIYILLVWLLPLFEYEFGWTSMARGSFFIWRDQEPVELIIQEEGAHLYGRLSDTAGKPVTNCVMQYCVMGDEGYGKNNKVYLDIKEDGNFLSGIVPPGVH